MSLKLLRNLSFFALAALFAALFPAASALVYLPAPVMAMLGALFGLLGLVLVILTIRLKDTGMRRTLFILAGASAATMPLAALLHNFVFEAFLFSLAIFVLPAMFVVGWLGACVLLATAAKPMTATWKLLLGLAVLLATAAFFVTVTRLGGEGYSVSSNTVQPPDKPIERVLLTVEVADPLENVFAQSFEHSLVSALESNGIDSKIASRSTQARGEVPGADEAKLFTPDVTMHIRIDPLYRMHRDGYEAIVGTIFEANLADTTGAPIWRLSGKVDYIADAFFKRPGYRAPEGIRKEFAWHTTAAIVRTFIADLKGEVSAPIYTDTEGRERHGQRTD